MDVLTGLSSTFESSLELSLTGRDDKTSIISETSSHDHVRNIVLMTGSIEDGELLGRGVKVGTTHLDGLTLGFFLIRVIHAVSEPPGVTTLFLGFNLVGLNLAFVNSSHLEHHLTANSGLAGINVTDEDHRDRLSALINDSNF